MINDVNTIQIGNEEVKLDPASLCFNETNLSSYLESEGGYYNFFGQKLADAEYLQQKYELEHEVIYAEKFKESKENGATEKLAEAYAKSDPDVEQAKSMFLVAKHNVRLLQQHLKAWDKNHDNAMSRGHFLRKEMDKLSPSVYGQRVDNYLEDRVSSIIKDAETQLENKE
jgi:hypothetical protein